MNKRLGIPNEQSKMATPQKLATQVTQDEEKQNKHSKMCVEPNYYHWVNISLFGLFVTTTKILMLSIVRV
jgi:hypothetical protein